MDHQKEASARVDSDPYYSDAAEPEVVVSEKEGTNADKHDPDGQKTGDDTKLPTYHHSRFLYGDPVDLGEHFVHGGLRFGQWRYSRLDLGIPDLHDLLWIRHSLVGRDGFDVSALLK